MRLYDQSVLLPEGADSTVATERLTFMEYELYHKLIEVFTKIKALPLICTEAVARTGIKELAKEYVGINLQTVGILDDPNGYGNMTSMTPVLDRNSIFNKHFVENANLGPNAKFASEFMFEKGGVGTINRKTMKVGGVFSKHPVTILMSDGFIRKNSAETLSAVFIHELGHMFTGYERALDMAFINLGIAMAIDRIYKIEDEEQRIKYVTDWSKTTGIKLDANEIRLEESNKKATFVRVMCDATRERRDEFGNPAYSARASEYAADQFLMYHGGAAAFANILNVPKRTTVDTIGQMLSLSCSMIGSFVIPIVAAATYCWALPLMIPLTAIGIASMSDPYTQTYDSDRQRLARILNGINNMLKDRKLSKDSRAALLNEASIVKNIIDNSKESKDFYDLVHRYILRKDVNVAKSIEFQERLERLSNNNLFQLAARLQ